MGRPARFDVVSVGSMARAWTCATSKTPFRSRAEDILYDEDETMRRKIWICCLLLLLALALPLGAQAAENLVQNGGFSNGTRAACPWAGPMRPGRRTRRSPPIGRKKWTETAACAWQNFSENDARLEQTVAVRGNTTYRISARMKAEGGRPRAHGRQPLRLREPCRVAGLCGHGRAVGAGRIVWKDRLLPGRDHRGPARGLPTARKTGLGLV